MIIHVVPHVSEKTLKMLVNRARTSLTQAIRDCSLRGVAVVGWADAIGAFLRFRQLV